MTVSIRMTDEEKSLAQSFAKLHGMSLSKAIKEVFFNAIEEEYDIAVADKALEEHRKDNKTISLEELEKDLNL